MACFSYILVNIGVHENLRDFLKSSCFMLSHEPEEAL